MGLAGNIVLNLYSVAILLIIFLQAESKTGRGTLQDRIFIGILQVTALMLVADTFGRFDGRPDTIFPILNSVGNFVVFLLSPVVPFLWLMYVYTQVYQDEKKAMRLLIPTGILLAAHTFLVIGSQFTGWLYTIDAQNIYHRGPLYLLSPSVLFITLLVATLMVVTNRSGVEKKRYYSLLFFSVPPFLTAVLHSFIYGISIALTGLVLSSLIVYLNIQNRSLITDYLTGVYNRKGFDAHLREKVRAGARGKAFSAILLDYDHFKSINDTFGHDIGDIALQEAAKLLKQSIRHTDFVARYGGDEFVLLLGTADRKELEAVVGRINNAIDTFNQKKLHPFSMGFSAGYAVYDTAAQPDAEAFVKLLDQMMYQMKQGKAPA